MAYAISIGMTLRIDKAGGIILRKAIRDRLQLTRRFRAGPRRTSRWPAASSGRTQIIHGPRTRHPGSPRPGAQRFQLRHDRGYHSRQANQRLTGSDYLCSGGFILPFLRFFGAHKLLMTANHFSPASNFDSETTTSPTAAPPAHNPRHTSASKNVPSNPSAATSLA